MQACRMFLYLYVFYYMCYIWYEETRIVYRTPRPVLKHVIEAYFYLVLAVTILVFSIKNATQIVVVAMDCSPAISRMQNQECTLEDYYDDSDLRYFLAALVACLILLVRTLL